MGGSSAFVILFFVLLSLFYVSVVTSTNPLGQKLLLSELMIATQTSTPTILPTSTSVATLVIPSKANPTATKTLVPNRPTKVVPTATPSPTNRFVSGRVVAEANCNRTVVHGMISGNRARLNGIHVRVWSSEAQDKPFLSQPSGEITELGPGGYEVLLDNKPKAGRWLVAVVDETGRAISKAKVIETTDQDCEKSRRGQQAIQINFLRREGTLGTSVPIFSPIPATFEAAPTATPTIIPFSTPDGITRTLNVPILMYHYISVPPPESHKYRLDLSIEPDLFRAQLIALREQKYTSITLSDLYYAIEAGKPLPEKPVVLTFDDGYADNYINAFPIMKEEGFVGTFFIITNLVEEWNVNYMMWPQIQEMKAAGMEFGSHTKSHASLPGMQAEEILRQLTESKAILEEQLGEEIITFSYPFGHFDDGVAHLTKEAGYKIAVTTKGGLSHSNGNIRTLRRVRVNGGMSPSGLTKTIDYWLKIAESEP